MGGGQQISALLTHHPPHAEEPDHLATNTSIKNKGCPHLHMNGGKTTTILASGKVRLSGLANKGVVYIIQFINCDAHCGCSRLQRKPDFCLNWFKVRESCTSDHLEWPRSNGKTWVKTIGFSIVGGLGSVNLTPLYMSPTENSYTYALLIEVVPETASPFPAKTDICEVPVNGLASISTPA